MTATAAGRLTTHVLDTASGCPAAGVRIELFRLAPNGREALAKMVTNADGRGDGPFLEGEAFKPGRYELVFHVAGYFRAVILLPPRSSTVFLVARTVNSAGRLPGFAARVRNMPLDPSPESRPE